MGNRGCPRRRCPRGDDLWNPEVDTGEKCAVGDCRSEGWLRRHSALVRLWHNADLRNPSSEVCFPTQSGRTLLKALKSASCQKPTLLRDAAEPRITDAEYETAIGR